MKQLKLKIETILQAIYDARTMFPKGEWMYSGAKENTNDILNLVIKEIKRIVKRTPAHLGYLVIRKEELLSILGNLYKEGK